MSRPQWLSIAAVLLLGILLIYFSRPIAEGFVGLFMKTPTTSTAPVAAVVIQTDGAVFVRKAGGTAFDPIRAPYELSHNDQLKTEHLSSAQIRFTSGWELQLLESTQIAIEFYRPDESSSPLLVTFLRGQYTVLTPGSPGLLYVQQDQKIFTPNFQVLDQPRTAEIAPPPLTPTTEKPEPLPSEAVETKLPSAKTPGKLPDKIVSSGDETLSNAYIEQTLGAQITSLRRCQLNSLRDNRPVEGNLLLSLTIAPSGKVDKVKILQDGMRNNQLNSCVSSVIERVQFKSFAGLPITLTYPVEFH